jgi:hypothetical protein
MNQLIRFIVNLGHDNYVFEWEHGLAWLDKNGQLTCDKGKRRTIHGWDAAVDFITEHHAKFQRSQEDPLLLRS